MYHQRRALCCASKHKRGEIVSDHVKRKEKEKEKEKMYSQRIDAKEKKDKARVY